MSGGAGRLIGGLVGAGVGFFLGGPAGAAYGFSIGSAVGGMLFPEHQSFQGPRLDDLKVQTSTYGAAIPIVYGAFQLAGNVIWLEGNKLKETKHKESAGGKGGPSQTQTTYTYSATFAVGLCEGPIFGVRRIWADTVLIYDAEKPAAGAPANGKELIAQVVDTTIRLFTKDFGPGITVYKGTADQTPHPRIEADRGTAPAYRNLAYVVFEDLQLEKFGNRIPNIRAEVVVLATDARPNRLATWEAPLQGPFDIEYDNGVVRVFRAENWSRDPSYQRDLVTDTYNPSGKLIASHSKRVADAYGGPGNWWPIKGHFGHYLVTDGNVWWYWDGIFGDEAKISSPQGTSYQPGTQRIFDDVVRIANNFDGTLRVTTWPIDVSGSFSAGSISPAWDRDFTILQGEDFVSNGHYYVFWDQVQNRAYIYQPEGSDASNSSARRLWIFDDQWAQIAKYDLSSILPSSASVQAVSANGDIILIGHTVIQLNDDGTAAELGTNPDIALYEHWPVGPGVVADSVGIITSAPAMTAQSQSLADVLTDLAKRAGLAPADYDASALAATIIRGYAMTRPTALRALISQLRPAFRFDLAEIDYKLRFVPRGSDLTATLSADDLAAHEPGQSRPAEVEHTRALETDLPRQVSLRYLDADMDYEQGVQYATRLITDAVNDQVVDLPVVFSADEAAQAVDSVLAEAWLGRDTYRLQLAMPWARLTPGDVIDVPLAAGTARVRIVQIDDGKPGLRLIEAAAESAAIYSSAAVGQAGEPPTVTLSIPGPTVLALLDAPLLRDQDDTAGIYLAAAGYLESWGGAVLYRSADGGNSYAAIDPPLLTAATIGFTTNTLANANPAVWDRGSSVNVKLLQGEELASTTETAVLNGANAVAIGAQGRWEIAAFRDAMLEADGSYTLSHFLRGLRGTEWAVSMHAVGDTLVLLTTNGSVQRLGLALDTIGLDRLYKAVSIGNSLTQATVQPFTFQAVSQLPLSVVHVKGRRNGAGDLSISWIRRTRVGGEWRDYTDAPLGEASEAYEVDILSGSTVKRTLSITSPSATYTAAQQTTDFGSAQGSIHIKIYQISAAVGRGYAAEATL